MPAKATRELTTLDGDDRATLLGLPQVSAVTRAYLEQLGRPQTGPLFLQVRRGGRYDRARHRLDGDATYTLAARWAG
jgi:hypothetical protein